MFLCITAKNSLLVAYAIGFRIAAVISGKAAVQRSNKRI